MHCRDVYFFTTLAPLCCDLLWVWMAVLLACVPYAADIHAFLRADSSSINVLAKTLEGYSSENARYSPAHSLTGKSCSTATFRLVKCHSERSSCFFYEYSVVNPWFFRMQLFVTDSA